MEREVIEDDVGPLCCNYATWNDGSFTCDMMIGKGIVYRQEDGEHDETFSSTYTFTIVSEEDEMEEKDEEFEWEWSFFDFGFENNLEKGRESFLLSLIPGVNQALNFMSMVDILQDIITLSFALSNEFEWLVIISGLMLFLDVYAVYLVALEDPFILVSFPSTYDLIPKLEKYSFIMIMVIDFIYDGLILGLFLLFSMLFNTDVNEVWWFLFAFTLFTLVLDIYQYYVFNKYNDGEEDLFQKYEEIEEKTNEIYEIDEDIE